MSIPASRLPLAAMALLFPLHMALAQMSPPSPSMAGIAINSISNSNLQRHMTPATQNAFSRPLASTPSSGQSSLSSIFGGGDKATASADPATRATVRSLSFSPSPAVSQSVRSSLSKQFAGTENSGMIQVIQSGAPWKEFSRLIGTYGYSSTNLVDVMTAYYVMTYEVANGRDESKNLDGIRSVHQQLATAFSNNAALGNLSDADKQQTAEIFGYIAIMAATSQNELVKRGQQDQLPQLRDSVHQAVLKQGIDLRQIRLTSQGFVPAS